MPTPLHPKTAVLLISHGSRHPDANRDLDYFAAALRERGSYAIIEPAFLELAEPNIEEGVANCLRQGAERVILLPYFLSAGIHVRRDLTGICHRLASAYPHVQFRLAEPLGRHALLLEIIEERARGALESK